MADGQATRAKVRLAERFGQWPLRTPAGEMTAAQALAVAEALVSRQSEGAGQGQDAPRKSKRQPRLSRDRLAAIAEGALQRAADARSEETGVSDV